MFGVQDMIQNMFVFVPVHSLSALCSWKGMSFNWKSLTYISRNVSAWFCDSNEINFDLFF